MYTVYSKNKQTKAAWYAFHIKNEYKSPIRGKSISIVYLNVNLIFVFANKNNYINFVCDELILCKLDRICKN